MWINGKALHEMTCEALAAAFTKFFDLADYGTSNSIMEEIQFRQRHPEYRVA